uniref:Uncharacterized protein n=1 Tax=Romanomermis culicivorax TaxID=13658 RepID=A0A915JPI5_ROMCU
MTTSLVFFDDTAGEPVVCFVQAPYFSDRKDGGLHDYDIWLDGPGPSKCFQVENSDQLSICNSNASSFDERRRLIRRLTRNDFSPSMSNIPSSSSAPPPSSFFLNDVDDVSLSDDSSPLAESIRDKSFESLCDRRPSNLDGENLALEILKFPPFSLLLSQNSRFDSRKQTQNSKFGCKISSSGIGKSKRKVSIKSGRDVCFDDGFTY